MVTPWGEEIFGVASVSFLEIPLTYLHPVRRHWWDLGSRELRTTNTRTLATKFLT